MLFYKGREFGFAGESEVRKDDPCVSKFRSRCDIRDNRSSCVRFFLVRQGFDCGKALSSTSALVDHCPSLYSDIARGMKACSSAMRRSSTGWVLRKAGVFLLCP